MDRIDALRLVVRMARRGSVTAAARDLRVKQGTASKWLARLEEDLGAALFDRTTRSLALTDAGRKVVRQAEAIVGEYDALREDLAADGAASTGRIRLNVPVVFGRLHAVPIALAFASRHPELALEISSNDRYVDLVDEGVDLAIRVGTPVDTSARGRKLAEGERIWVAAPSYLALRPAPRTPADLASHARIAFLNATPDASADGGGGRPATGTDARGRHVADNSEVVLEMARRGWGVALLADWLVAEDLRRGTLVALLPDARRPSAPVYALTPPGRRARAIVRALVDEFALRLPERLAALRGAP